MGRKDRQTGSVAAVPGESGVVRQKTALKNNLYQNSFCQQILQRESPCRQESLLMHFRAHINSTAFSQTAESQCSFSSCTSRRPLLCLDQHCDKKKITFFFLNRHSFLKYFYLMAAKHTHAGARVI